MDHEAARGKIVSFIREQRRLSGTDGVVLGLSGGVDSALCGYLAVEALGKEKVLGLLMPEMGVTDPMDVTDAMDVVARLRIEYRVVDITKVLGSFSIVIGDYDEEATKPNGNLKARTRMSVLYYYANKLNRLVCGTGNRTEILLGYFTKHGDAGVDILPIGGLYKSDVRAMATRLGVPESIIKKPPTAGLWRGQTDEGEMGVTYDAADRILRGYSESGQSAREISDSLGISPELVERVVGMVERNKHKRNLPPVAQV